MHTSKEKIYTFYKEHRRMPSYSEIGKLVGFASKNAVSRLVQKLIKEGAVSKDTQGRLLPMRAQGEIQMLGLVEAGFPAVAEAELADTITLDEYLIDNREASFLLRVKGDSMIDAGIQEGDLVLVERGREVRQGDIVIAEVDGEWTMKYYRTKAGKVYLEPANKNYPLIFPTQALNIAAIVRAVIRKY
ncbi:MAG: repressor LexA [Candidatus Zambryskibacteria bacterium RIFCSPHIGHO2_01_FULL_49_18]|uniref:Repressor LexA n=1 Tax=Candidatus Zambryskibacteria bacterium RIFCSPHIGHO2_01_FULL_49_18 TaxID=1802740 RepID=A0A1G2T566_9BACT|nr:MAG: repressor LexA [Candidatus Zambryskibacteria bacterium RIFCSPHIGHO2_01_FULL_49_18]